MSGADAISYRSLAGGGQRSAVDGLSIGPEEESTRQLTVDGVGRTRPSPFRGGWLIATLAVTAGIALCLWLAFWQFGRLNDRRAANAVALARLESPAVALTGAPVTADDLELRRVTARGMFDYANQVVLRYRAYDGAPGVHIVTPLRIEGSETAVLVDRGWIPVDRMGDLAQFSAPAGIVEFQGIGRRSQVRPSSLAPADPPLGPERARLDEWFRIDVPRIQEQTPYALLPVFVELESPGDSASPAPLPRPQPDLELSEGSHLGYALQWLAFAGILGGGYLFLLYARPRSRALGATEDDED